VAAATSTPELATTLIARLRGHHDVGLGNILGSSIFNALFIAPVAALIQPYAVKMPEISSTLAFGVVTTLVIWPGERGVLGRGRGFILLGLYAVFVFITTQQPAPAHP
ncbi:MAG: hypothetical protein JNG86_07845, partial [Verrucomicrobiaceae bacterium]|nr:hypothetical protein [Verrucomicrobiaceae bacterium]